MNYTSLSKKKQQLDRLRPLPAELVRNLDDWFAVELTYTSNALEGNTLSRRETAVVVERGLTVGGKSLREHLEATNHFAALHYVMQLVDGSTRPLTEGEILAIHQLILKGIDDANAGHYRRVPVRIAGSAVVMPNAQKVPPLMQAFEDWLKGEGCTLHPVALATEAHFRLVTIHPFVDGNGRTARLLMNLLLLRHGYPPAIIRPRDRLNYISALETAQLGGSRAAFDALIAASVNRSLDLYLNAAAGKTPRAVALNASGLMKIGALAKRAGVAVPTIRFWTLKGLLKIASTTTSGYQLYSPEMVARCGQIQRLKAKRHTLEEIRQILSEGVDS